MDSRVLTCPTCGLKPGLGLATGGLCRPNVLACEVRDSLVDRVDACEAQGTANAPPPAIAPASAFVWRCFACTNQLPKPMTTPQIARIIGSKSAKTTTTCRARERCCFASAWQRWLAGGGWSAGRSRSASSPGVQVDLASFMMERNLNGESSLTVTGVPTIPAGVAAPVVRVADGEGDRALQSLRRRLGTSGNVESSCWGPECVTVRSPVSPWTVRPAVDHRPTGALVRKAVHVEPVVSPMPNWMIPTTRIRSGNRMRANSTVAWPLSRSWRRRDLR